MNDKKRTLVIGPGTMGLSHAKSYPKLDGFEIVGFVSRSISQRKDIPACFDYVPRFENYKEALEATKPDAVSMLSSLDGLVSINSNQLGQYQEIKNER